MNKKSRSFVATGALTLLALSSSAAAADPAALPCQGGTIQLRPGSEVDYGWTGHTHDSELSAAVPFGFAVVRRCTDDGSTCERDADCTNLECAASCDCNLDRTCEIAGPVGQKHCLTTLADCESDADCHLGVPCVFLSAPPQPLAAAGVPTCTVSFFDEPLTGTADLASGEVELSSKLRWRVFLGNSDDQPCPRCGDPASNPQLGQSSTCEGGQFRGAACTVDAVDPTFGGTSFDCPPGLEYNVSGSGLAIRLDELTTGTTTRTAGLPCGNFSLHSNPLVPGSNPKCSDRRAANDPVCTSNADCRRCTGASTECTSNADCEGNGSCAEAPDQPITCGYWCHCGFCNGNPMLPCFDSSQCPGGQACQTGPGTASQQNAPQQKPNDCASDAFLCGQVKDEKCATAVDYACSGKPYRPCPSGSTVCEDTDAGTCVASERPCFESRISRSGVPSPAGSFCAVDGTACISNADCTAAGDSCAADVLVPRLAGLFCSAGVSSMAVSTLQGITGPGALTWETLIRICRCGDGDAACNDLCRALDPCPQSNDGTPCDDGLFCNGTDSCFEGSCSQHAGDPCEERPGDGDPDCSETCDEEAGGCTGHDPDGSTCSDMDSCTIGDSCAGGTCMPGTVEDPGCVPTTTLDEGPLCGDWTGDSMLTASDALEVLRGAVGLHPCPLYVCDYDGDTRVTSTDALAVLRAAVSLPSQPGCPDEAAG